MTARSPLAPLSLALLLLAPPPSAAEEAPKKEASGPETRMALTGDFVELGTGHPAVVRGGAAIEIVNRAPWPIDVKLGQGAGRIEQGKSLLIKIDAGEQPLEVSSPKAGDDRLGGVLELQAGHAYALGVAWERVLVRDEPVPAAEGSTAEGKSRGEASDSARAQTRSAGKKSEKGEIEPSKIKKSGRVDVGRKRKKDR